MKARLTGAELRALREAAGFRLAGEYDGSDKARGALQSGAHKLGTTVIWLPFTRGEAKALLRAVSQMTGGNGYDFEEWVKCTSGKHQEWDALLRGEAKLREAE